MSNTLTQTLYIYDSGLQAELQGYLGLPPAQVFVLPKLLLLKYCHGIRIAFVTND